MVAPHIMRHRDIMKRLVDRTEALRRDHHIVASHQQIGLMDFRRYAIEIGSVSAILHHASAVGCRLCLVFSRFTVQLGLAAQHFYNPGKVLSAAAHIGEEGEQCLRF
mgnify:CR=1 FL=1